MTNCRLHSGGLVVEIAMHPVRGFQLRYLGPEAGGAPAGEDPNGPLPASPDVPPGPSLLATRGAGYAGLGVLDAMTVPDLAPVALLPGRIEQISECEAVLHAHDTAQGVQLAAYLTFSEGVLCVRNVLRNVADRSLSVARCSSLLLPLPDWADDVIFHHGSWAREGHEVRRPLDEGGLIRTSRLGRTGFSGPPALTFCAGETGEATGPALNVQLCWSGSHELRVIQLPDGARELSVEPVFLPGEITLEPGGSFEMPEAVMTVTGQGLNGLQDRLHALARVRSRPVKRPVHFNTWEARYFDFDADSLLDLARSTAELGAERFVLDDGWFTGRGDDTTSLGDWTPDVDRFPNGFEAFIDEVRSLGLGFGLWVEPEMVSPLSDLFAAHPEWVLGAPAHDLPTGRNQLVLDLSLAPVQDYLFEALSNLLDSGHIEYLKWDCNRELYPMQRAGQVRNVSQVHGVYQLMGHIRKAFPDVEIESCASGGGRIDFGILPHATRFWASDATDALDRIRIQQAFLRHLPPEMMGSHIGPSPNPITGRRFSMRFRAWVALFGHMGLELDPEQLTESERLDLSAAISVYKRFRDEMATARFRRVTAGQGLNVSALMFADGASGLLRVLRTETTQGLRVAPVTLPFLASDSTYRITEVFLSGRADADRGAFTGAQLAWTGLDADPGKPLQGRLFRYQHMEAQA